MIGATSVKTNVVLKSQTLATLRHVAQGLHVWSTAWEIPSADVSLDLCQNLTPSRAVDPSASETQTVRGALFVKTRGALRSPTHVTHLLVDRTPFAQSTALETQFAGVKRVLFLSLIPSQAADLNVLEIPTVRVDMSVKTRGVLRNLIPVTHHLVVQEQPVWSTTLETQFADVSLVLCQSLTPSLVVDQSA